MQLFDEIKETVASAEEDAQEFYQKGNKAAGTRLRKAMMEIKNKAHELRKDVQAKKNEM